MGGAACRVHALINPQIRSAPCRNIVVHGLEAVGKTAVVQAVLNAISDGQGADAERDGIGPDADSLRHAFVKCAECISGRQLLEKLTLAAAVATGYRGTLGRCENLAQLAVEMGMLLEWWTEAGRRKKRLVLVIDGIDKQKDAPHTLIPAVARLGESVSLLHRLILQTPAYTLRYLASPQYFLSQLHHLISSTFTVFHTYISQLTRRLNCCKYWR